MLESPPEGGGKLHNLLFAAFIALVLLAPPWLRAATWESTFSLPVTYEYHTNPTLSSTEEQSISKLVLIPEYNLNVTQDLSKWAANLTYKIERSSNVDVSADRQYPNLNLSWNKILEKGSMGLAAHYDDNSTRETEFDDSGQVVADGSRKLTSISANWSHFINEKTSFSINGSYSEVRYANIGLVNYSSGALSTSINYKLSSKIEPFLTLSTSKTETDNAGNNTYVRSLSLGSLYSASEQLSFIGSGSVNKVEATVDRTTESASITMNYVTELIQSSLSFSRTLAPSGITGSVSESDQVNGSLNYSLSETSNLGFNVNYRENRDINKNKTASFSGSYSKTLSAIWKWRLSVQHRKLTSAGVNVDNNIIGMTLIVNTN